MTLLLILLILIILVLLFWIASLKRRTQPPAVPPPPPGRPVSPGATESEQDPGPSSIIDFNGAIAGALKGFDDYGLSTRADWAPFLGPPAKPGTPILVQRLDATEQGRDYYYLVPLGPSDDVVTAVARVDGVSGKYLEASAFSREKRSWGTMVAALRTESSTRKRIAGRTFERQNDQGATVADARGVGVHPVFVWKPCVESQSPFFPFRLVSIGDQPRYIRIDGKEFPSLTALGPGSLVLKKDNGYTSA